MRIARARALILSCIVYASLPTAAAGQFGVPFATYRTFETPHFILTFEAGLEDHARRAATLAEAAHARLARTYGSTPRGKIRLVIVDQGDVFNGAATPSPTNRVIAFAHTPVEGELFYTRDPLELLVTHEIAHVFHLDEARGVWRVLRAVFGRSELGFPHVFDGRALIEGLATFYESRLTDGGRVRGAEFPETLRAAVLETTGPQLDEAEADPGAWPFDRHYVFGGLFLDHVAGKYGEDAPAAWMAQRAGSLASIVSRGAGVGDRFGGRSLSQEWQEWIAAERDEALQLRERLRAEPPGLAETTRVCSLAHYTAFPRVSPDGTRIAFIANDDGRRPPGLYVADLRACEPRRIARVDSAHPFAWSADGRAIVFSQLGLVDNARVFGDLYRVEVSSGAIERLTHSARLTSPDVHPDGRTIVAVQYDRDRSRLVTVDVASATVTPLTEFSTAIAWGPARWSPDGATLAAVRFTRGASFDLVLLAADGRSLRSLTDDRALESVPEWDAGAPAGVQRLFFTSDRTGVRELYAVELEGDAASRLYVVARVATGMHEVSVVPTTASTGRTAVVAIVSHADGRHLERLDVERAAWIAAQPSAAEYARQAGGREAVPAPVDVTATQSYAPARDLLPTAWSPEFESVEGLGAFVGASARGVDVIGRHEWQGNAAFGRDGRAIGSANYIYRRLSHAYLFGRLASTWRLEQRLESDAGELLRLERKLSLAAGMVVPWTTFRRRTFLSAAFEIEDRNHEHRGAGAHAADPARQDPALVGGALGLSFGNPQGAPRAISPQDGVRMSAFVDYLRATDGDRWRSGWDVAAAVYRSSPSWTTSGRPVFAGSARVAEQRGPAASRLTAGGVGSTTVEEVGSFPVRGYPAGFVSANAMWSGSAEMRLPIARVSRGLGALPFYLQRLSGSWFADGAGAADRVGRLGAPQLLSTGAELTSDFLVFSIPLRVRAGVGVPLKGLGDVSRGEARFYVTAGTSF